MLYIIAVYNSERIETYEVEWSRVEYERHDAWCAENPDVPPMPDPISLLTPMTQEKENTSHIADESTTIDDSKKEMIVVWVGGWVGGGVGITKTGCPYYAGSQPGSDGAATIGMRPRIARSIRAFQRQSAQLTF